MERATITLQRKGQEVLVDIRPVTQAALAEVLATSATPSVFAESVTRDSPQAIAQGIQFLRGFVVAGTVRVRANGRTYRLALEVDPDRDDVLTPEDLEEPGLAGGDPFKNTMTLARAIAELSGMPELFRTSGEEGPAPESGN